MGRATFSFGSLGADDTIPSGTPLIATPPVQPVSPGTIPTATDGAAVQQPVTVSPKPLITTGLPSVIIDQSPVVLPSSSQPTPVVPSLRPTFWQKYKNPLIVGGAFLLLWKVTK